jgi:hypothetical protein
MVTGRADIATGPIGPGRKNGPCSISRLGVDHYVTLYSDVIHSLADRSENIIYKVKVVDLYTAVSYIRCSGLQSWQLAGKTRGAHF